MVSHRRHGVPNPVSSSRTGPPAPCQPGGLHTRYDHQNRLVCKDVDLDGKGSKNHDCQAQECLTYVTAVFAA